MTPEDNPTIPFGYCHCGCGNKTKMSNGEPRRYLFAHGGRTTHGHGRSGKQTRTYRSWCAMLGRCRNPKHSGFIWYGARGITVCERWNSFEVFLRDMGECPEGYSIERKDANGNYEPINCKWATEIEQANNRRNTHFVEYNGERMSIKQLSLKVGIKRATLSQRINSGMSVDQAITLPIRQSTRWHDIKR